MNLIVLSGVLLSTLASLFVGGRMLLLAARTRGLPELCMGIALAGAGGFGVLLSFLARVYTGALGGAAGWLLGIAQVCVLAGPVAVGLFTWRVFRPEAVWARLVFTGGAGVIGAVWTVNCATVGFREFQQSGAAFWTGYAMRTLAYTWSCLEAGLYASKLRRRRALGLADPIIVDRIRLWTTTMGVAVYMHVPILLKAAGVLETDAAVRVLLSIGGLATSVGLWLAFFPPRAYLRLVAGESGAPLTGRA